MRCLNRLFGFAYVFIYTPSSHSFTTLLGASDELVVYLVVHKRALNEGVLATAVRTLIDLIRLLLLILSFLEVTLAAHEFLAL
jgi:hypothetical protein